MDTVATSSVRGWCIVFPSNSIREPAQVQPLSRASPPHFPPQPTTDRKTPTPVAEYFNSTPTHFWAAKSLQIVIAFMKLKDTLSLEENL